MVKSRPAWGGFLIFRFVFKDSIAESLTGRSGFSARVVLHELIIPLFSCSLTKQTGSKAGISRIAANCNMEVTLGNFSMADA